VVDDNGVRHDFTDLQGVAEESRALVASTGATQLLSTHGR